MKIIKAQKIGDAGETTTLFLASKNKDWIARKQDKDFGVDIEMELIEDNLVTGQFVKVQVKAMEKYRITKGKISYPIKSNFLKYCKECRVPVILVLIDVTNTKGFFIWVQEYLHGKELNLNLSKTINIGVPLENDFEKGLKYEIKNIALRMNHTQLLLDLKASLETSFLLGNEDVYEKLLSLSLGVAKTNVLEVEKIIRDLIDLGNMTWGTYEGNKKSKILYSLCLQFGDRFSVENIKNMIIRESTYSRVGIVALGILYDNFPTYIKSLDLPKQFSDANDTNLLIVYYCKFKERYLGKSLSSVLANKDVDFKIERLDIDKSHIDELFLKLPNRGDSIILDYVYYK